ncbi:MAG TPA: protoporphyrinogen oxidase [Gemmatimonadales bacterium]|jgi:oxygen-dependent protoporphyrinogen oxidase
MTGMRVAVVGGGLSGLAAAVRLRELGAAPTLFEAAGEVGGVVRSVRHGEWLVEAGPCMAAEPPADVRALLDRAGVGGRTVRADPVAANRCIVRDGRPVDLPHTTAEFRSSALLSLAGQLRMLKERLIPASAPVEETVEAFARRRFGDEVAERMFDPLLASTSSGRSDQALARYAFPAVVGHERGSGSGLQGGARERMQARRRARSAPSGSWSCEGGMQGLPRQLAATLPDVVTGAPVRAIQVSATGATVMAEGAPPRAFDALVLALPAPAYQQLECIGIAPATLDAVATLPCAGIAAVHLGYARQQLGRLPAAGRILVPAVEGSPVLSVVIPSAGFTDRAPADHLLLTLFLGGARRPELLTLDDAELVDRAATALAGWIDVSGAPVLAAVSRWDAALPQAVAGHTARLQAAADAEAAAPQVALCGAWRDGLSVSEVLLGGLRSAERLIGRIEGMAATP